MLYVKSIKNGVDTVEELSTRMPLKGSPSNVVYVQADGDELERIKVTMTGIPMAANNRVVEWHGDLAKFIAANWR